MTKTQPWAVLLDTNGFDAVIDTPGALQACVDLTTAGRLQIQSTQFIDEELAAMPDAARRERLQSVPRELVASWGWVLGRSALGMFRLADDTVHSQIEGGRHFEDSMIELVASLDDVELVTNDHRLSKRARARGVVVTTPADFVTRILAL